MLAAIRVDSSVEIGTGHVMRCITLAKELQNTGFEILFICKEHKLNLILVIERHGFSVARLPVDNCVSKLDVSNYNSWVGGSIVDDSELTLRSIEKWPYFNRLHKLDLLIVDHYGLGSLWERDFRNIADKIMVIDDLANRSHDCDILLDQTLNRKVENYTQYEEGQTDYLLGVEYSLLRDEFLEFRYKSMQRRISPKVRSILINLGGSDPKNFTLEVLESLLCSSIKYSITIILGHASPWFEMINDYLSRLSFDVKLLHGIDNMAKTLVDIDIVIGAAGSAAWERCALGVPSFIVVMADNQKKVARELEDAGAVIVIKGGDGFKKIPELLQQLTAPQLALMSLNSSKIIDGLGVQRVVKRIGRAL